MTDEHYMKLALELAKSAEGQTSPNPMVGAVVVKDGQIAGMGAHLRAGEHHAEVHALNMAGDKAMDSVIYVTLEPCSHYGKTPPCADRIIEAGVKKVVIAAIDQNPIVSGKGIQRLREAGLEVVTGICRQEAESMNKVFNHFQKHRKPYVTLKTAVSLDGKIAAASGESKWITSAESRDDAHRYRHSHDAILVGIGTVLADNPSLTTRLPNGGSNPIRIILDTTLQTPIEAKLVTDSEAPTWIITGSGVSMEQILPYTEKGVRVIPLSTPSIEIESVLELLGSENITSLFVEGGSSVNGSFLQSGSIQQVIMYQAPILIGGSDAPQPFGGGGIERLKDALKLELESVERIGPDIKITASVRGGS
ncbi:riboflavin biosynthesis protein RibD [Fictibacillus aquaticus]|uniref:Riboflavin biosynthesis protein RibD n=1 Tax=Fictibacillus aquaticus TaxID=2021314 RepID=A0A235F6E3_9BACL|nr:bifunctional diaminohydroxyphosphoribosylaminopyrimidine deaminase/5-amino-6-(5-phosphoribosylamino)uracil reductase RibD [Fictibacillus aquaticus]OYD56871.1 riboflavin biosynthesis protein RibD [Fictibacillus aquaticus]